MIFWNGIFEFDEKNGIFEMDGKNGEWDRRNRMDDKHYLVMVANGWQIRPKSMEIGIGWGHKPECLMAASAACSSRCCGKRKGEREREREMLNGYGSDWVTDSNEIHGNRDWIGSQTRMAWFLAQEFWLKIFWFKVSWSSFGTRFALGRMGPEIQGTLTGEFEENVGPEIQDHPKFWLKT